MSLHLNASWRDGSCSCLIEGCRSAPFEVRTAAIPLTGIPCWRIEMIMRPAIGFLVLT